MSADAQSAISSPAALDRPFYFIVVLWGERFRKYFLDFCLASALSPGNIPALLASRRSKFLIATRPEDWAAMRETQMLRCSSVISSRSMSKYRRVRLATPVTSI